MKNVELNGLSFCYEYLFIDLKIRSILIFQKIMNDMVLVPGTHSI